MRRKKKSEIDDLIGYLVKSSIDDLTEQINEEEMEEVELTPYDLADAYMEIMTAFMGIGFTRGEAFELLLNSI